MKDTLEKPKLKEKLAQLGHLFLIYVTPQRVNYKLFEKMDNPIYESYIRESKDYFWSTFLKIAAVTLGGTIFALASTVTDIDFFLVLSRFLILNLALSFGGSIALTKLRYPKILNQVLDSKYNPKNYHKKEESKTNKKEISLNQNKELDTEKDAKLYQDITDIYLYLEDGDPLKDLIEVNMNYLYYLRQSLKKVNKDEKRIMVIAQMDKIKELLLDIVEKQKRNKELSRERLHLFTSEDSHE